MSQTNAGKFRTDREAFKNKGGKDIIRVLPGARQVYTCVSSTLVSCVTHWDGRQTRFCPGLLDNCCFCKDGIRQRWEGWLAVCRRGQGHVLFLAITPNAVETCPRLQERDKTLAGLDLIVGREGTGINSAMVVAIQQSIPMAVLLPKCPDVCSWVERLWGLDKGCLVRHPQPDDEVDLAELEAEQAAIADPLYVRKFIGALKASIGSTTMGRATINTLGGEI